MIKKKTSAEIMDILENAQNDIEKIKDDVSIINNNLIKELSVINNMQEFTVSQTNNMIEKLNGTPQEKFNTKFLFSEAEIVDGSYSTYGSNIMPKLLGIPADIFNFNTAAGIFFKDNANVSMGGVTKMEYRSMLMDDKSIEKGIAFEEFDERDITVTVEVNPDNLLGSTSFNMIDILPYMPGSFDITKIKVYTMDDYKRQIDTPSFTLTSKMVDMGTGKIFLGESRLLYKCEIDVHINFKNAAGKYPFGLKHLYFQKGTYDTSSYAVVKISKSNFIDTIGEDIKIHSQNGKINTTCKKADVKFYQTFEEGELSIEIPTSKNSVQNPINRNLKDVYMHIPITCTMISMTLAMTSR